MNSVALSIIVEQVVDGAWDSISLIARLTNSLVCDMAMMVDNRLDSAVAISAIT